MEQSSSMRSNAVRHLSIIGFIVIAIVYLAIIQGLGQLLTRDLDTKYAAPTSVEELWRSISVGVGASLVFVYLIVAILHWWRPVFVDDRPVQRWVIVIPIVMVVAILAGTNYSGLADRGGSFTALLLLTALMVGFAEEGMFRGIGVVAFRTNGFSEAKVALWTSVLFGLAHATNLISEGPRALVQVLVTVAAGYFFYLVRRRSGGLLMPAILHGLWDFGLISGSVVPDKSYLGAALFILADLALIIIVLVRRHRIAPEPSPSMAPDATRG